MAVMDCRVVDGKRGSSIRDFITSLAKSCSSPLNRNKAGMMQLGRSRDSGADLVTPLSFRHSAAADCSVCGR